MVQRCMSLLSIFCRNFFCLNAENFRRGESFSVSLISDVEKVCIRRGEGVGGGEYQDFPSKFFRLTVPKTFVGEPFCAVSESFRLRKVYG